MHPERVVQMVERVQVHTLTGARPAAAGDGVDTSSWRSGNYGPIATQIYFDGDQTANVTQPTGGAVGVELWGFKLAQWWRIAILNGGNQIPIASATLGESERVDFAGGFDRLFVAGTASAGTVTVQFVPWEVVR